jgi:allantoinase
VHNTDIAIAGGKIAKVAPAIDPCGAAKSAGNGGSPSRRGRRAHNTAASTRHWREDAVSEARPRRWARVTSSLNYFRTGQYYLNKGGRYAKFFPEVLRTSKNRFHVDYGYHLAPMDKTHIDEIPMLIEKHGVASFKIFMFTLTGCTARAIRSASSDDRQGTSATTSHFEFVMRGIQAAREKMPERAKQISLSLHCETAEIMTAYTRIVEKDKSLEGLAAYSASRPQHSEGLAVFIASYLAHETALTNINLLHLSSRKAVQAALMMADVFPHIDFRRGVTIGHLMLTRPEGRGAGMVNPPIRPRGDVEFLWMRCSPASSTGFSDHACCRHEMKIPALFRQYLMAKAASAAPDICCPRWQVCAAA